MTLRVRTVSLVASFVAALTVVWGGGLAATAAEASSRLALVSSDPATDAAVAHLPSEVVLTFNQTLLPSTVLSVSAPDGETLASGPVAVHGGAARMAIAGAGVAGVYTVSYSAADSDGRTTPGSFAFTVTVGTGPTGKPGKGHSASPTPAAPQQPVADTTTTRSAAPAAITGGANTSLTITSTPAWWTFAGVALVVACVLVVFLGFRRRTPVRPPGSETPAAR